MSVCKNSDSASIEACPRMPWIMKVEEEFVATNQLNAAYQSTNIDHMMRLNVESCTRPGRLTKIMVTLGEKNSQPTGINEIINAGANILRLNMSHRDEKWHENIARVIKEATRQKPVTKNERILKNNKQALGLAMDLRGPEIRTGIFNGDPKCQGRAVFTEGDVVSLLTNKESKRAGDSTAFWISHPDLPEICEKGDRIMVDCGTVGLQVYHVGKCSVDCTVTKAGNLCNEKSVVLVDTLVDLPEISEDDDAHVELGIKMEFDFIIVSHVRNGQTISKIKERIKLLGNRPICILAKISTKQGFDSIDDILRQTDGIIIDRRFMKLVVGEEKLFLVEKSIIAKSNRVGKPVVIGFDISASRNDGNCQLELSLVANAIIEGVDGILLRTGDLNVEETVDLIRRANLVCREAENARWQRQIFQELSQKASIPVEPTHSIAIAAVQLSLKVNASGIIAITTTGRTAMMLSIYRPRCPIVAITRYGIVARWLQLYFAVHPLHYTNDPNDDWHKDIDDRIQSGMNYLRSNAFVEIGEPVVIVSGWRRGSGFTNCIRVVYASPCRVSNNPDFEEIW